MTAPVIPADVVRGNPILAQDWNAVLRALRSANIDFGDLMGGARNVNPEDDWFWAVVLPKKPPREYFEYAFERAEAEAGQQGEYLRNPLDVPTPEQYGTLQDPGNEFYWVQEVDVFAATPGYDRLLFSPRWQSARIGIACNLAEMSVAQESRHRITQPRIYPNADTRYYTNANEVELSGAHGYAPGQIVRVWRVLSLAPPAGRGETQTYPFGLKQESWVFSLALPWIRTARVYGRRGTPGQITEVNGYETEDADGSAGMHSHTLRVDETGVHNIVYGDWGDSGLDRFEGSDLVNQQFNGILGDGYLGIVPPTEPASRGFVFDAEDGSPRRYSTETIFETPE